MKIAFFEVKDEDIEFFSRELGEYDLTFSDSPLTLENVDLVKDYDILSVFIRSKIDDNILERLPNLKLITTRSTGYDHIDIEACKRRGILVANVPGYGTNAVAEHTFALILAIAKRLLESVDRTKKGNFSCEGLTGFELKGKTLGIIGAGRIGRRVAEIAKAFGMRVIACDVYKNYEEAKRIGYEYVDFETLLKESDIISLHVNLTKETYHMLSEREFEKMKEGVIIINTARGSLIDSRALLKSIKKWKGKLCRIRCSRRVGRYRRGAKCLI